MQMRATKLQKILEESAMCPEAVLTAGLQDYLKRPAAIKSVERRALDASTHAMERWKVTLESGECVRLLFKQLQPDRIQDANILPEKNPREVLIYQRLLTRQRFGAPAVYASVYDEAQQCYWLFVEDLGHESLKHCDVEGWLAAARQLATFNGTYLDREAELRALQCLGEHDADFYFRHATTARHAICKAGGEDLLAEYDRHMRPFPAVAEWLLRQPQTLVHGDIFAANLLIQPGPRVRPIDWEWAAVGSPGWDIARLLYGWDTDRLELVDAFLNELECHSTLRLNAEDFERTLACCEIVHALRFLSLAVEEDITSVPAALMELERTFRVLHQQHK